MRGACKTCWAVTGIRTTVRQSGGQVEKMSDTNAAARVNGRPVVLRRGTVLTMDDNHTVRR